MKKIISLILLAAMLSVVMASCKKKVATEDPTQTNPMANIRCTITEDEWTEFLELKNYTAEIKCQTTQIYDNGAPEVYNETSVVRITPKAQYTEGCDSAGNTYKTYKVIAAYGKKYDLVVNGDGSIDAYNATQGIDSVGVLYGFDTVEFEAIVYDAADHSYSFTVSDDEGQYQFKAWFEEGVIVKLIATLTSEYTYGEGEDAASMFRQQTLEITFTSIGTTAVEVPKFQRPPV